MSETTVRKRPESSKILLKKTGISIFWKISVRLSKFICILYSMTDVASIYTAIITRFHRNFCHFQSFWLFLTGVMNFIFLKIFVKFCEIFGHSNTPVFFRFSINRRKTRKVERPKFFFPTRCLTIITLIF